ncbi:6559_t:CDS:1, partial [Acaulospora morrowiae]
MPRRLITPQSPFCSCTKHIIDTMRENGLTPTLTELNQAIKIEAKYNGDWLAATTLFLDFDKLVWDRLSRLVRSGEVDQDEGSKQSLKELWDQTPSALRPMSKTEIGYIRQVYQIMVRYSPTLNDANKYYLHLLRNHLDTPIYDDECINHCLNSLIYLISMSEDVDFLEKGTELVQIALDRGLGINKPGQVLRSVSKQILSFNGLEISKDGHLLEKENLIIQGGKQNT